MMMMMMVMMNHGNEVSIVENKYKAPATTTSPQFKQKKTTRPQFRLSAKKLPQSAPKPPLVEALVIRLMGNHRDSPPAGALRVF